MNTPPEPERLPETEPESRGRTFGLAWTWVALIIAIVFIGGWLLFVLLAEDEVDDVETADDPAAVGNLEDDADESSTDTSIDSQEPVSLLDLLAQPEEFYGRSVTIAARAAQAVGERGLMVGPSPLVTEGNLDDRLVVLLPEDVDPPGPDTDLRVTGELRRADAAFEGELDVSLVDLGLDDFRGEPILVAEEIGPQE